MVPLSGNQDLTYLDAAGHSWTISGPTKATMHPADRSGALQQTTCALVGNAKQCHILSTVQAGGGCSDCTQLMMMLSNGWRHAAHKCTRKQVSTPCITPSTSPSITLSPSHFRHIQKPHLFHIWTSHCRLTWGTETVQVTPLQRTLASSPQSECASCLQCFDAVGWAAGKASGL